MDPIEIEFAEEGDDVDYRGALKAAGMLLESSEDELQEFKDYWVNYNEELE
jgi:hypothetical protein